MVNVRPARVTSAVPFSTIQVGREVMGDMRSRGWCTDRHHGSRVRHARCRGEHCRTAQAVADQQGWYSVVLAQVIRGRHKIPNVRREVRIGELTLTAADAGKVKAQDGNVASGQTPGNPRCSVDVLAAGEAMGEQGEGARLRRQVKTRRQHDSSGAGKLDLPRFGHDDSYVLASRTRWRGYAWVNAHHPPRRSPSSAWRP